MSQVQTGAKLTLSINNIVVAYASQVSYQYNLNLQEIRTIDTNEVTEHAELHTTVTFTCSAFRVAYKTAIANGWMPKIASFLQQPTLTATIFSDFVQTSPTAKNITTATLITVTGLKCTGRSGSVNARGVWEEQLTFVGKVLYDEME